MQARHIEFSEVALDLSALNTPASFEASYLLHQLLSSTQEGITRGVYAFPEKQMRLTINADLLPMAALEACENNLSCYSLANQQGKVYLFSLGVCYYEAKVDFCVSNDLESILDTMVKLRTRLVKQLNALIEKERESNRVCEPYQTPVTYDLNKMKSSLKEIQFDISLVMSAQEEGATQEDIQRACFSVSKAHAELIKKEKQITFYESVLIHAKNHWHRKTINSLDFKFNQQNEFICQLIKAGKGVDAFYQGVDYPYQGMRCVLTHSLVLRRREKKNDSVVDILESKQSTNNPVKAVYRVISMRVGSQASDKTETKHKQIYKFDPTPNFEAEFEKTQQLAETLHVRNFHPGFFSMRHKGDDLTTYFRRKFSKFYEKHWADLPRELYIDLMRILLKLTWKAYGQLVFQCKGRPHGDIKPDNMVYSEDEDALTLIDFGSRITPKYAAPETLKTREISRRGDIYCMARSFVRLYGGSHEIYHYPSGESLLKKVDAAISVLTTDDLLGVFDKKMAFIVDQGILTDDLNKKIRELFSACLERDPSKRPEARFLFEKFGELYQQYYAMHNLGVKLAKISSL